MGGGGGPPDVPPDDEDEDDDDDEDEEDEEEGDDNRSRKGRRGLRDDREMKSERPRISPPMAKELDNWKMQLLMNVLSACADPDRYRHVDEVVGSGSGDQPRPQFPERFRRRRIRHD